MLYCFDAHDNASLNDVSGQLRRKYLLACIDACSDRFAMLQAVLLSIVTGYVSCANILLLQDIPSPSHSIWTTELAMGLVKGGHNVTWLGPGNFRKHKPMNNFHPIYLDGVGGESSEEAVEDAIGAPTYKLLLVFYEYDLLACKETYQSKGLQTILDYPDNFKFDAIVIDLTLSGCLLPLIKRFNFPPSIGVTPFLFPYYLALDFGNTIDHSYLPGFLVSFSENMNFLERLINYFWINTDLFMRQMYLKPQLQELVMNKFGADMDVEEMRRHVSLLLVNVDSALHYPQQFAPNIIPVGGLHVQRAGQLPQDLRSILDSAKKGVILFSLGTNVRSDKLKPEIKTAILEALGKLDQTVIWKFETNLTDVPPNVIIRNWVPQTEILAHPKTVLFISHGGGLSTIEAAYYGVPVLGMPFFVDQFTNLAMMENKGIARQINPHTISADGLYNSIKEMLSNKKYAKNMKETSSRMRDQVQTPLERAVYWIEYSVRHNGTHVLNLKSRDLPLFITNGLDIHLFLLLVGCAIVLVIISLCKYCSTCTTRKPKMKKQ